LEKRLKKIHPKTLIAAHTTITYSSIIRPFKAIPAIPKPLPDLFFFTSDIDKQNPVIAATMTTIIHAKRIM
jgi:hypothetical protein